MFILSKHIKLLLCDNLDLTQLLYYGCGGKIQSQGKTFVSKICTFVLISLRKFNFHTIWFEETLMKMVILSRGYFLSFIVISLKLKLYPQWEEELHHQEAFTSHPGLIDIKTKLLTWVFTLANSSGQYNAFFDVLVISAQSSFLVLKEK